VREGGRTDKREEERKSGGERKKEREGHLMSLISDGHTSRKTKGSRTEKKPGPWYLGPAETL
jgi:hypothetical protein